MSRDWQFGDKFTSEEKLVDGEFQNYLEEQSSQHKIEPKKFKW